MKSKSINPEKFKVTNINDLEILYSVLRETYPNNEIEILFNWNTKEYNVYVKDKPYRQDPEVPIDLNIQVVYGDTDSVFLRFKYNRDDFELNRRDTFRLATNCGDNLTENIFNRKPIELEFEKVFHPFVLLTKKRYIANKYENQKNPFELKCVDAKGIALTRRDYCPMVKKCYKQIIDTILNDKTSTGEQINKSVDSINRFYL
jgi:DNA polymerase elongation subunit (family B)